MEALSFEGVLSSAASIDAASIVTSGNSPRRMTAPLRFLGRRPLLTSLVIYALLGAVANFPIWPGDPARLAQCSCGGDKDVIQTVWFLAWTPFALLHGHNLFLTNWLNYPVGVNLAQNTGMPLLGLVTAPLTLLVSPVASENLLRFLAFPLSAIAMYFVASRWLTSAPAAFVAGLLYGFSPYVVSQAEVHLNLSFVPLPPLIFYALYRLVILHTPSPWRWGLVLGALGAAQYFISAEILATTGLVALLALVLLALSHPRTALACAPRALLGLVVGGVLLSACIGYPAYLMARGPLHYVGPSQTSETVYNADLVGSVLPTSAQLVAPRRLAAVGSSLVAGAANVDENGSYLSLPLLVLLAVAIIRYWRRRWLVFAALMAGLSFVLSLGTSLEVDGRSVTLPFELPFEALRRLPFMNDLLPARLALYVSFFVALALALALDESLAARRRAPATLARAVAERPRRIRGLAPGFVALLALAALAALLPRWPYRTETPRSLGEHAAGLGAIPAGDVVLTYPYATPSTDAPMLWQALDSMRFKLIGGYALRRGPDATATLLPSALKPADVEGMLANALAVGPVPIPTIPYLAPTRREVDAATAIVIDHTPLRGTHPAKAALHGVVQSANPGTRTFFVAESNGDLASVHVNKTTRYAEPPGSAPRFGGVTRGEEVAVYGTEKSGTLTPGGRVKDLRRFLTEHQVNDLFVQLGRHDSNLVAYWVTELLGPPTRDSGGGALWLHVQRSLRGTT